MSFEFYSEVRTELLRSCGTGGSITVCPCVSIQGVLLHLPGPRVPRAGPQGGDDQRGGAHSPGAQPLLHLQPAHLRAALPLPLPGLELLEVSCVCVCECERVRVCVRVQAFMHVCVDVCVCVCVCRR